jgi:hypothetical protein
MALRWSRTLDTCSHRHALTRWPPRDKLTPTAVDTGLQLQSVTNSLGLCDSLAPTALAADAELAAALGDLVKDAKPAFVAPSAR